MVDGETLDLQFRDHGERDLVTVGRSDIHGFKITQWIRALAADSEPSLLLPRDRAAVAGLQHHRMRHEPGWRDL